MLKPAFQKGDGLLQDIDSLYNDGDGFCVWWFGQSGFLIKYRGHQLLFDPYLSDSLTKKYAETDKPHVRVSERVIDPASLTGIEVVTSSHNHTDHLDADTLVPLSWANPGMTLVLPEANMDFARDRLNEGVPEMAGLNDGTHVDRGVFRAGFGLPFCRLALCQCGVGDEKLGRFLAAQAAGEPVNVARFTGSKEADARRRELRRHGDIDVPAHRLVRHLEVVVGKAARDLRDIGKAVIDERDAGEFTARQLAIDGRVVGGLDELVGMRRDRRERKGDHGKPGELQSGIGASCGTDRETGKARSRECGSKWG